MYTGFMMIDPAGYRLLSSYGNQYGNWGTSGGTCGGNPASAELTPHPALIEEFPGERVA